MERVVEAGDEFRNGFSDGMRPACQERKETARFPGVDVGSDGLALHLQAGRRLPLLVAAPQDAAGPMHPRIRGTSMIDQQGKTGLLIARLKESLPIEANITGSPTD
jgi:hypothetical protein